MTLLSRTSDKDLYYYYCILLYLNSNDNLKYIKGLLKHCHMSHVLHNSQILVQRERQVFILKPEVLTMP